MVLKNNATMTLKEKIQILTENYRVRNLAKLHEQH